MTEKIKYYLFESTWGQKGYFLKKGESGVYTISVEKAIHDECNVSAKINEVRIIESTSEEFKSIVKKRIKNLRAELDTKDRIEKLERILEEI